MYRQFDSDKKRKKLFDYNNFMQDDIGDKPSALNKMLTTNHHHSIFSNPPNRIATGGEVYFDEIDNKVYRGNMNGTWTEATELEPVIIKHLFATIVKQDGLNIWGLGIDAVAGSGNIKNDRGRGSISHPGHTYNGLFDLGYLLGKLFPNPSMMYPWLLEFQLRLKYGTPKPQSSDTKATVPSDPEMHIMALYNYSATDAFGGNPSQLHKTKAKDTAVQVSQNEIINKMNDRNLKEAEKERDVKNIELQKKLDYYKQ
ncbi:hypothetical protein IUY40_06505 [Flavobacterium sp. ALJ2]|uniref:hypothetical protein n=1 Tax=Flavobacterium sp. ALJ2 TaxID=2786960 RepID=UPI0018A0809B|nr:hypothetical protein [Flavobacterium sp. ALJ2]MBF7091186.1 hypothetical protein [Flavobacterium sp. ALJ2]